MKISRIIINDPQNSWIAWILAIIVIPSIGASLTYYYKINPQFSILNNIIKPNKELIIVATNYKANRNENLDIIFDDFIFTNKGILSDTKINGYNKWTFKIIDQHYIKKYPSLLKNGEHFVQLRFQGGKKSEKIKVLFIDHVPSVEAKKIQSQINGVDTKLLVGNARTIYEKNYLHIEILYYHEGPSTEKITVPLQNIKMSNDQFFCEFKIPLKNFPKIKKTDPRFDKTFFALKISDKATNEFYYTETYGQYIVRGTKEFGSRSTNIKIDRKENIKDNISENNIQIEQKLFQFTSESDQLIDITVTTRLINSRNARRIEWKAKANRFKPLALIFRDSEHIASTTSNSYTDTDTIKKKVVSYEVELEDKHGVKMRSSSFKYNMNDSYYKNPKTEFSINNNNINNVTHYFLLDKSGSMWAQCLVDGYSYFKKSKNYIYQALKSILLIKTNIVYLFLLDERLEKNYKQIKSINEAKLLLDQIKPGGKTTIGDNIEKIRKQIKSSKLKNIELHFFSDMKENSVGKYPLVQAMTSLNNSLILNKIKFKIYIYLCKGIYNKEEDYLKNLFFNKNIFVEIVLLQ